MSRPLGSGRGYDVEETAEETTPLLLHEPTKPGKRQPRRRTRPETSNGGSRIEAGPSLRRPAPYADTGSSDGARPSADAASGLLPRWSRALAALRTGHLPSSAQSVKLCDAALDSETLAAEQSGTVWQGPDLGRGRIGTGRLSEKGERVRLATRRATLAHRDLLKRRNPDLATGVTPGDAWQELWYAWQQGELATVNTPRRRETVDRGEAEEHRDPLAQSVRSAIFTLVRLVVTSASLRQLVAELLLLLRDLAQLQLDQRDLQPGVKEKLEKAVETVEEKTVGQDRVEEHDLAASEERAQGSTSQERSSVEADSGKRKVLLPEQDADELRRRILDRLRQIIAELQRTKAYQQAMDSLLAAVRTRLLSLLDEMDPSTSTLAIAAADSRSSSRNPLELLVLLIRPFVEDADPELARLLDDWALRFRAVLTGPDSIGVSSSTAQEQELPTPPYESIKAFVEQADEFITSTLLKPNYLGSNASYRSLGVLTDLIEGIERDTPVWLAQVRQLAREAISSLLCFANDPVLREAVVADAEVVGATSAWLGTAGLVLGKAASGGFFGLGEAVWGDVVEWIVPRVLGVLSEASLPRLEFAMPNVAVALEPPSVISTSFIPAKISLRQSSHLSYTPSSSLATLALPLSASTPSTAETPAADSRTHFSSTNVLSVEGVQLEVLNVGYFVSYKAGIPCFGDITERGLLDLHFGVDDDAATTDPNKNAAEGLAFDLTFRTPTSTSSDNDGPLFEVDHSRTSVRLRDFRLEPHQSSHPWLMWFFRPLLRKAVQTVIEHEFKEKVLEGGAEWLARIGGEVRGRKAAIEAEEESTTSGVWSWVRSLWNVLTGPDDDAQPREDDSPAQQQLRHIASSPSSDSSREASAVHVHLTGQGISADLDDLEATVGLGSEGVVLPAGEAEIPLPEGKQPKKGVARAAREEVERVVRQGKAAGRAGMGVIGSAVEARREWREEIAVDGLAGRDGWRSEAFEL